MELVIILLAFATLCIQLGFSETSEEFLQRHQRARGDDGLAPLYGAEHDSRFPNEYVVMFQPGHTLQDHFDSIGMDLSNFTRFMSFNDGYRAKIDDFILNSHVRLDSGVLLVENNGPIQLIQPFDSYDSESAERQKRYTIEVLERQAPYGLQMLSAPGKLPTPVEDDEEYHYNWGAGEGVNVYVFDTG